MFGEVVLIVGGGWRGLFLVLGVYEEVVMVGIYYDGKFYEFVLWEGSVEWDIFIWGFWKMLVK